jgi:6-phosphogluconolactonase
MFRGFNVETVRRKMKKYTKYYKNLNAAGAAAAKFIAGLAKREIKNKGYFTMAVSGGGDPVPCYKKLAASNIRWDRTFIFWQDDRFVDYGHKDSNVKLVYDNLLKRAKAPFDKIFPAPSPSHIRNPVKTAFAYEVIIRRLFAHLQPSSKIPVIDLIIAGVGPDGHTASLFPKDKRALGEKKRLIISVKAPAYAAVRDRITMTLPLINNAKNVLFIVSGEGKAEAMKGILKGDKKYPAARVKAKKNLIWMIDKSVM